MKKKEMTDYEFEKWQEKMRNDITYYVEAALSDIRKLRKMKEEEKAIYRLKLADLRIADLQFTINCIDKKLKEIVEQKTKEFAR